MTLGEKLLQARLAKGLSQRQTAGDYMTRNMLSQLEHDQAAPSLKTLEYLASVLDVTVSWLIGEEPDLPGQGTVDRARAFYAQKQWRECAAVLDQKLEALTAEEELLLCRACLHISREALDSRDLFSAEQYARRVCSLDGLYIQLEERYQAMCILTRCALEKEQAAEDTMNRLSEFCASLGHERNLHSLKARFALQNQDYDRAEQEIWQMSADSFEALLLRGLLSLKRQQFDGALEFLLAAEKLGTKSDLDRHNLYRGLEQAFKAKDDYKSAYHYAVLRME